MDVHHLAAASSAKKMLCVISRRANETQVSHLPRGLTLAWARQTLFGAYVDLEKLAR